MDAQFVILPPALWGSSVLLSVATWISRETLRLCVALIPATNFGTTIGKWLAGRLSPTSFRLILAAILLAMALGLFADVTLRS